MSRWWSSSLWPSCSARERSIGAVESGSRPATTINQLSSPPRPRRRHSPHRRQACVPVAAHPSRPAHSSARTVEPPSLHLQPARARIVGQASRRDRSSARPAERPFSDKVMVCSVQEPTSVTVVQPEPESSKTAVFGHFFGSLTLFWGLCVTH